MSRRYIAFLIFTLCISSTGLTAPLTAEQRACVFRSPLSFGASVTAETPMFIPGYQRVLRVRAAARGIFFIGDFGPSPNRILLASYAHKWPHQMGVNISKMFTREYADIGSEQVRAMLTGDHRAAFQDASVIIGIDAFYRDSVWNTCRHGGDGNAGNGGVEKSIEDLIEASRAKGKTLILGNVPHENPMNVLIDSETLGIPGLWYNPKSNCVTSINKTLQRLCTVENGCYLVDIDSMVATLNSGGTLPLNGKNYSQYWIRPDGVHLSFHGSEYLFQQIVKALEANPPKCAMPN